MRIVVLADMSLPLVSEARLREIRTVVGSPLDGKHMNPYPRLISLLMHPVVGSVLDYEQRLMEETAKDESLRQYLEWILAQDIPEPPFECVDSWLRGLATTSYSDISAVVELRSYLSFGEVNYLPLAGDGTDSYIVISDPAALEPLQQTSVDEPSQKNHPALLRLSVNRADPTGGRPPFIVLPIGRLLRVNRAFVATDLELAEKVASIWLKSPHNGGLKIVEDALISLGYATIDDQSAYTRATLRYMLDIANGLEHHQSLKKAQNNLITEKSRHNRWQNVLRNPKWFEETNYVVVVDAVHSDHPVWLIQKHSQEDDVVTSKMVEAHNGKTIFLKIDEKFDTLHYMMTAKEWRESSHQIGSLIAARIKESMIRGKVTVQAADVDELAEVLRVYTTTGLQRGERAEEAQKVIF